MQTPYILPLLTQCHFPGHPTFSTMPSRQANSDPTPEAVSATAKAEGGPPKKGSASAQMQSEFTRARNASQGIGGNKSTKTPAGQIVSDVSKAEGGTTKGSASAKLQSEITKAQNAGQDIGGTGAAVDPATQSQLDKEANLAEAQERVLPKMENDPEHVTQEDASLLRSRETRAHGVTEKGGVAATAQHLAAENEKKGTV